MEDPGVLTSDDQAVLTLSAGFVNSVRTPMDKVSEKLEELKYVGKKQRTMKFKRDTFYSFYAHF